MPTSPAHVTGALPEAPAYMLLPRMVIRGLWPYCISAILCVLVLNSIYKLPRIDYTVPLNDYGDATFYNMVVKNFVEADHYYINPLLGAPGQQLMYDFPLPHAVHVLGWAILKLFTHNYAVVINLYYLLTFILETISALYVFRRFGISSSLGIAGGLLFAFLPFHLMRSQGHLMLTSYYLVPLVVMVALWISRGEQMFAFQGHGAVPYGSRFITRAGIISVVISMLVGSDNPYWALFSGLFLVVGGLVGTLYFGKRRAALAACVLAAVVLAAFTANLVPNLVYTREHGLNPVNVRSPAEAEVYGLKLTQMLLPVRGHRIPALASLQASYDAQAPLVNENATATLGIVGSIGFLLLLGCFLVEKCDADLRALSIMNLVAFLVGTIGGLGSLFSFTVWSQYRGYNRISVFISFFSLFSVLKVLDLLIGYRVDTRFRGSVLLAVSLLLGGLGLADEIPRHVSGNRRVVEATYRQDQVFIDRIQALVPPRSMIFQFPYVPFLGSVPAGTAMVQYDDVKGYLHSNSLRWSGGAIIGRDIDLWIRDVAAKSPAEMVVALARAGFAGIYIDRFGYADRGALLESQLKRVLAEGPIVSVNGRRSFFRLDPSLAKNLPPAATEALVDDPSTPLLSVQVVDGCWPIESNAESNWHWCGNQVEILIDNPTNRLAQLELKAQIATGRAEFSHLTMSFPGFSRQMLVNNTGKDFTTSFRVPPGEIAVKLQCDAKPVVAAGDPRILVFLIRNLQWTTKQTPAREKP